jgi:hypothetical protein
MQDCRKNTGKLSDSLKVVVDVECLSALQIVGRLMHRKVIISSLNRKGL